MTRRAAACVAGALVVGVLAGCGAVSGAEAAPGQAAPVVTTADAEAEAELSGVEFVDVPLTLEGHPADIYSAIAVYERTLWRAGTEQDAGLTFYEPGAPILRVGEDAPVVGRGTGVLGGGVRVSIGDITVDGTTATGIVCRDLTGLTVDGTAPGVDAQQVRTWLTLSRGDWRVENIDHIGTC